MLPTVLYIDADACPVKQEVYRVAERHALKGTAIKVFVVTNSPIAVPRDPMIERVVVGSGMDEADNWIAERARAGDIVITADVPLASRCVKAGAEVIAPNGRVFTADSIGMTLATRNLMDSLRSAGEITSGPKPFTPRDRSSFLAALDQAIVRLKRAGLAGETGSTRRKTQRCSLRPHPCGRGQRRTFSKYSQVRALQPETPHPFLPLNLRAALSRKGRGHDNDRCIQETPP